MNGSVPRWAAWVAGLGVLALVWVFAYAIPRMRDLERLEQSTARFERDRGAIAEALAGYAGVRRDLPNPSPNTSGWISQNALSGLESHLDFNNPYGNGKGAQVKLRALRADQVSRFLTHLRRVNLVVKTMKLQDRDGDGRWELELMVEVPS